ncbi:MAG: BBP7 family outer membrane beta-barrel protein [Planctomycetia bacterium]|nr:BBP7 family outer membrane beta-barrel protein [Planctomycetia bacterium]
MKRAPICLLLFLLSVLHARSASAQEVDEWQPAGDTMFGDAPGAARDGYTWWASSEFLVWWTKDGPAPLPLVTTAPAGSPAPIPGALDQPDTTVVLGGKQDVHPAQLGGRFTLGGWLAPESGVGVEANLLFLSKSTVSTTVTDIG